MGELPRILVAEDNPVCQRVATALLESLGCAVDIRGTGRSAVEACLQMPYSLVLMDGFMPDMDGFEAAREIRRLERGRRTPIVALTASVRERDRQRCFAAGMDDCLAKPVSREILAAVLARWISAS
jgi:CheY-like chemotaxis protein